MNAFTVKSSDLSGPTNPGGIWSPRFLTLKLAIDNNEKPDNVLQALTDWLASRNITPSQLDKILNLPDLNAAHDALIGLIGSGFKVQHVPPTMKAVLRAAIQRLAQKYADRGEQDLELERQRLANIRSKFTECVDPKEIVADLLR